MNIYTYIHALMQYGKRKHIYQEEDYYYVLNAILATLKLNEYVESDIEFDEKNMSLDNILDGIMSYAIQENILENTQVNKDLFDTKIMGCMTPLPSMIHARFQEAYQTSPEAATNYFYTLCKDINYVRASRIAKDIHFDYPCEFGTLNISINMSKPEKDPNDIKKLLTMKKSGYPKCMLCKENVNYEGRLDFPARQNLRFVPVTLHHSQFYMQYSPYSYYNEHTIVFKEEHSNMKVDFEAVCQLVDFVEAFPHYFLGSNAGLPIVGGSILNHHHFQGGRAILPMQNAKEEYVKTQNEVEYTLLKWPLNVIRLRGEKNAVLKECEKVFTKWNQYENKKLCIIANDENGPHNAITPIVRKNKGQFEVDLVLRNNLTTKDRPLGLYHPRSEYWHIKKENIGLIEVMGLAILPSRLKNEMELVKKYLLKEPLSQEEMGKIESHLPWADKLACQNTINHATIDTIIQNGIGETFKNVMMDCAVFKEDNKDELVSWIQSI